MIMDGRDSFYQWDLDRKLIVEDNSITEAHFTNSLTPNALVVEVKDGLVDIPNILLQNDFDIKVYAYDGNCVKACEKFEVERRAKPEDYVYTETEIKRYSDLEERINALEDTEANVDLTGYATEEYVDNAIANIDLPTSGKYELIETIVLEEATDWIESRIYPDKYTKMLLCMKVKPDGIERTGYARVAYGANWYMSGCGGKVSTNYTGDWKWCSRFYFELNDGVWDIKGYTGSEADMSQLLGQVSCGNLFNENQVANINCWQIYTFNQAYPVGTEITVYGIKEG